MLDLHQGDWHCQPLDSILAALETDRNGLDVEEARRRLQRYGANRPKPAKRRGPLTRLILQFHNFLIYVLLASAAVLAVLRHWIDAGVVFGVTLVNALIGFVQEGKAERALESIRELLSPSASVVRAGVRSSIPAEELVPGDRVLLEAGDRVPADLRLLDANVLRIQEAVLTGESVSVEKSTAAVDTETLLADRTCMAYSGTLVTYGQGGGIVVATGDTTEIGRVGTLLAGIELRDTPLLRQLSGFGRWLTLGIVALAFSTFAYGWLVHERPAVEMFLAAVGLAVAAIPEGLPAIVTITLAIGVQRMAARGAVVRRLPAVETLGSVSVVCSDKTGTLTRNEMMVQSIATGDALYTVDGDGYAPEGRFLLDSEPVKADEIDALHDLFAACAQCNDAALIERDREWVLEGDPTEGALLAVALKGGVDPAFLAGRYPRLDVIPFDADRRYMATLHVGNEGTRVFVKGAPEEVIAMCDRQRGASADQLLDEAYWRQRMLEIAGQAQRVLAVAMKAFAEGKTTIQDQDVAAELTLLGLVGIADPPRVEAFDAIAQCQAAGVRVKMITGDHAATARAIAERLGLTRTETVLSGAELEDLDDTALAERVRDTDVFARTSPQHKLRLVQALQGKGAVVAMTGDGVNDAPALKQANVGVAMGRNGTEVAKEASEMVITDDNFVSIVAAIEQGRTVYDNIRKSIAWILPTSFGEAFVIIAAVILGSALPITAVQVLWINMVTTVTLALALAFEPSETDIMQRPPRPPGEPLMPGQVVWRTALVSAVFVICTFALFQWQQRSGASLELARTVAVNAIVMFEIAYLFSVRRTHGTGWRERSFSDLRPALGASALVFLFQLGLTYLPPLQRLFGTAGLDFGHWFVVLLVACGVYLLVEFEKWVFARIKPRV